MGSILSRRNGKKKATDQLERISEHLRRLSKERAETELRRSGLLFKVSVILAILFIFATTYVYLSRGSRLIHSPVFLIASFGMTIFSIFIARWMTNVYYEKRLEWKDRKILDLTKQKKDILENVKETETYKVANEILDKFETPDSNRPSSSKQQPLHTSTPGLSPIPIHRNFAQNMAMPNRRPPPSSPSPMINRVEQRTPMKDQTMVTPRSVLPMPRPIIPRDRTPIDKMVDYLFGDGPNNRYALICNECYSHNGMALREEFEYLAFRCCFCSAFNPARRQRPHLPPLENNGEMERSTADFNPARRQRPHLPPLENNGVMERERENNGVMEMERSNGDFNLKSNSNHHHTHTHSETSNRGFSESDMAIGEQWSNGKGTVQAIDTDHDTDTDNDHLEPFESKLNDESKKAMGSTPSLVEDPVPNPKNED